MSRVRNKKQPADRAPEEDQETQRTLLSGIEDDWLTARIRGDAESTRRLLDENYQGCNSDGLAQNKSDFVQFVESSRGPFADGVHTDRNIQIHGDMAVSTGVVTLRSADREHAFRYLRVYQKREGEWRLIASQSTRLRTA